MNKSKRVILVISYVLIFMLSFYYFAVGLFPSKELGVYMANSLAKKFPKLKVTFARVELGYDLKLQIEPLVLTNSDSGVEYLRVKRVRVGISPLSIFVMRPILIGEGLVEGSLVVARIEAPFKNLWKFEKFDIRFDDVELSKFNFIGEMTDYKLHGKLNGTVALKGVLRGIDSTDGIVNMKIKDLTVDFKKDSLGISELKMDNIAIVGNFDKGVFRTESVKGSGKDINVDISGEIAFKKPLTNSTLNLDLNVICGMKFMERFSKNSPVRSVLEKRLRSSNKVNIKLTGTLEQLKWQVK